MQAQALSPGLLLVHLRGYPGLCPALQVKCPPTSRTRIPGCCSAGGVPWCHPRYPGTQPPVPGHRWEKTVPTAGGDSLSGPVHRHLHAVLRCQLSDSYQVPTAGNPSLQAHRVLGKADPLGRRRGISSLISSDASRLRGPGACQQPSQARRPTPGTQDTLSYGKRDIFRGPGQTQRPLPGCL